ncbi:hypothetical protein C5B91_15445 [Haloferax sp. Atlit-10N]|uniref:Uncharacterized protein n=1 Tax=Haloferax prahovense (strain DSM 18310 / JCM 13924 / TL6) TaxID=1227461 RepID=M0GA11_HALPT|nr:MULTISPECIES: hypothetical protein [Haloferax]ELZ69111.1 hypothetical protein C457_09746 [Haloferax prahovense DSM 18310]RDZ42200.1 hypothetical protein C5B86_16010 [Haloferax sp. Atlit-19N]RDZ42486.1 hypothetical protein C5B87_16275 [Haloferax sp. Atlit-16N]RDZ57359.1 hypothetical protein C5B91_15445 [Haloferax sp. Atlit-10N]
MPRTRRDVLASLAGVGVAGLAGCTALDAGESESDDPALDAAGLRQVRQLGSPAFPARVPAPIADSFLEQGRARARELLDSCPETMSPEEVPNEAVRDIYAEAYADAAEDLAPADADESPFEALRGLRYARGAAAMAKGTYDAAVGDLTESDVRDEAEAVRADIESFRLGTRYLGDEPDRALVVYEAVENLVAAAVRYLDNADEYGRYTDSAPQVGELLDAVESARASLGGARHVRDRYLATIADPLDFTDAFESTASSLVEVVADRLAEYPEEGELEAVVEAEGFDPEELESTPAKDLLMETFIDFGSNVHTVPEALRSGRFATALVGAHTAETHRRAFEDAVTAVKRGRYESVESAAAVRDAKLGALEALEAARSDGSNPHLTRRALVDVAHMVGRGDDYFRDDYYSDDDPRAARNALAQYATTEFAARETPDVSAWVLGTLAAERGGVHR